MGFQHSAKMVRCTRTGEAVPPWLAGADQGVANAKSFELDAKDSVAQLGAVVCRDSLQLPGGGDCRMLPDDAPGARETADAEAVHLQELTGMIE